MNKVAAEILASWIPCKMERNRWRGILRYGVFKTLRLLGQLKRHTSEPPYYLAVCAIAKNEGDYFREWIEWHRRMGVERFYIYDNESTDQTRQVLAPYIAEGIVSYLYWPGYRQQMAAYDHCMEHNRFDARWIAFIDLDEFIVPIKDKTIPDFLHRMEQFSSIEINWLIYGSGGQKEKSSEPVMKRFRFHSLPGHKLNRHVKSIVNPLRVCNMTGCHEAARLCGDAADSHGEIIRQNFREREPQQDVIRINHYAVRSYEEFVEKQGRGRASGTNRTVKPEYFEKYDLNDIEEK